MQGQGLICNSKRVSVFLVLFVFLGVLSVQGAITNVQVVKAGAVVSSFPVTITPDSDGTDDFLNINFTGANHDYMVVIDTNGSAGAQPITDWGNRSGKDWTWRGYLGDNGNAYVQWEGRDMDWRMVANGTYQVWIIEDTANNQFASDTTINSTITITVSTKYIYGTVTDGSDPIAGVRVNAGGPNGWGEAMTDAQGHYVVSGLKAGTYTINASKDGYFYNSGQDSSVTLSGASAQKDVTMAPAVVVPLVVTIENNVPFNPTDGVDGSLWLNADARCTNGAGWANGNGQIAEGAFSTNMNINLQELIANKNWTVRVTGECSYGNVRIAYSGTATFTKTLVDEHGHVDVTLTRANSVSGSVLLPDPDAAPGQGEPSWNINVRLVNTINPSIEAWGWGQISQSSVNQSGGYNFYISAVPAGTYTCSIQVNGFKTSTISNVVVSTADVALNPVTLNAGLSITGTLTIGGTVNQITSIWLNAWSPANQNGCGQQITVPSGTNQSVSFTISGLESGEYELWCGMTGREFTVNGEKPWQNRIAAGDSNVQLVLAPYTGVIQGQLSAAPLNNLNNVIVIAQPLWGGNQQTPSFSFIESGSYTLNGLGTGEYLVIANEYANTGVFEGGDGIPVPTGQVALFSQIVYVANGHTTGVNINLQAPHSVTGSVAISGALPVTPDQIFVVAIPIKLAMMGGADIQGGMIMAPVTGGQFTIGLGSDTYILTLRGYNQGSEVKFATQQLVKVVNDDMSGVAFTISNGHAATVTLNFPGQVSQGDNGRFIGNIELYQGETRISDSNRQVMFHADDPQQETYDPADAIYVNEGATNASVALEHLTGTVGNPKSYTVRFYSPMFMMASKNFTVAGSDVTTSLSLAEGATITGKVVDAATGSPLTSNLTISCEAVPWVDGSNRSTQWDPNGAFNATTKKFYLRNLPAGTYLLRIEYQNSSESNINYASTSMYGITIPANNTDEFDVGTIKLRQGTTISGRVTNAQGTVGLRNIPVEAEIMDSKFGKVLIEAKTDVDGYYTLSGVDPEIPYWVVSAAIRPEVWDMMRTHCGYGEEVKYSIQPGDSGVDFALTPTSATLTGTITIPDNHTFAPPFKMGEVDMPSAMIVLQQKGRVYSDPMGGIQASSNPSEGTSTSYTIGNLVPGSYRLMVFSRGLATYVENEVIISAGSNSLNVTLAEGATISGSVTKADGTNPTTNDLDCVVAMNPLTQELAFGTFTTDSATGKITAYSLSGLRPGIEYRLALVSPGSDGPGTIYVQADPQTATEASDTLTLNMVMAESAPTFMINVSKVGGVVYANVFSTTHLRDDDVNSMLATNGGGDISDAVLSADKTMLTFAYTPAGGEQAVDITLTAHYGADFTEVSQSWGINLLVDGANQGLVNPFMGGNISMGGGDASGIYFEPGDLDVDSADEAVVNVSKSNVGAGGEAAGIESFAAIFGYGRNLGVFKAAGDYLIAPEASADLPSWASAKSQEYNFEIVGANITPESSVAVTLQYVEGADTSQLHVLHYVGGTWTIEATNKTIDEVNQTITVDVTSLSPFVAVEGTPPADAPTNDTNASGGGGGGGGGCFIETAYAGSSLLFIFMLLALIPVVIPIRKR